MGVISLGRIEKISLLFLIILLPFQNTIFGLSPLGFLGKSPSFVFIFFMYLFSLIKFFTLDGKVDRFKFFIVFYFVVFNVFSLFVFFDGFVYGRSLLGKGVNLLILHILFLFPIFIFVSFRDQLYRYVFFASIAICLLGVILGDFFHLSIIETGFFHISERPSLRPRGFSYEPSMLSVTIFPLLFSALCLNNKSRRFSIFHMLLLFFVSILTSSKGAMATLLISFFVVYFFSKKCFSINGFLVIIFIFLVSSFVASFLVRYMVLDVDTSTSVATRITCVFISIFSLLKYPLGVGYFGFLFSFQENIRPAIDFISSVSPFNLNFSEVSGYINATTDSAIGTKSFFFNNVIFFGWPFVFAFFYYVIIVVKKCREYKRTDLELSFLFVVVSLVTFVEGIGLYPISIFVAILNYELFKERIYIESI